MVSALGKPKFRFAIDSWPKIEQQYGRLLPLNVRQHILEVTGSYLYFEVFERQAKPLRFAIERVEAISRAANNLRLVLTGRASDESVYARHLIGKHFSDRRLKTNRGNMTETLAGVLTSLLVACDLALQEMKDTPSFRVGDCWNKWIRNLTSIARKNKLPFSVSKASGKAAATSPFVLMVAELQRHLDKGARRHSHSNSALAAAITRARKRNHANVKGQ
jgi:hypothetical protein